MGELKIYVNEIDHVIAESVDDAHKVTAELYGYDEEQATRERVDNPFALRSSDKPISIYLDDGSKVKTTKTPAEWIAIEGRGLLCSTEY